MVYKVVAQRRVPAFSVGTTAITKRVHITPHVNAGAFAVCVRCEEGTMAWGFGTSWAEAEAAAVADAARRA